LRSFTTFCLIVFLVQIPSWAGSREPAAAPDQKGRYLVEIGAIDHSIIPGEVIEVVAYDSKTNMLKLSIMGWNHKLTEHTTPDYFIKAIGDPNTERTAMLLKRPQNLVGGVYRTTKELPVYTAKGVELKRETIVPRNPSRAISSVK
jgi:hypothetical protein